MIFVLVVLNFAISWFNAWSVGRSWAETAAAGGWVRLMSWAGAIMSACGFTWVYLVILGLIASGLGKLDRLYVEAMFSLGYLTIIVPIIVSGLLITVDSWAHFWRRRSLGSGAVAGWNSFAQVYNTYQAMSAIPQALSIVKEAFGGRRRSSDSKTDPRAAMAAFAIALVIVAVIGGALTTTLIVRATTRRHARDVAVRYGGQEPAYA